MFAYTMNMVPFYFYLLNCPELKENVYAEQNYACCVCTVYFVGMQRESFGVCHETSRTIEEHSLHLTKKLDVCDYLNCSGDPLCKGNFMVK